MWNKEINYLVDKLKELKINKEKPEFKIITDEIIISGRFENKEQLKKIIDKLELTKDKYKIDMNIIMNGEDFENYFSLPITKEELDELRKHAIEMENKLNNK